MNRAAAPRNVPTVSPRPDKSRAVETARLASAVYDGNESGADDDSDKPVKVKITRWPNIVIAEGEFQTLRETCNFADRLSAGLVCTIEVKYPAELESQEDSNAN